jgi:two-component system sensor histidine kinase GlrK
VKERPKQAADPSAREPIPLPQRKPVMTLLSRLLLSHSVPVVIVTFALVFALSALFRISVVLTTLSEAELHSLEDEGVLHAQGEAASRVAPRIADKTLELARVRHPASTVPKGVLEVVDGYLAVGREASHGNVCVKLLESPVQSRRAQLDEQLTNLWVARLEELHRAVKDKEGTARSMAVHATWVGMPLALGSCVLALVVARRMATSVKEPLADLSRMAQRVGRGDFQGRVTVRGPVEIVALADELERMRSQLEQLETLKQGFLASVSHELRTPLSKIREALALLHDGAVGQLEERQARVVQIARTACEREIRMVTTLLDLSRLRAGSPIRQRERCAIDGVLNSALSDERADALQRGVILELHTHEEAPACRCDPVLMERALANLVRNAVSVSRAGQRVRIDRTVERDRDGRPGTWICVRVSDEGPGVPQELRARLFDAFVTSAVPAVGRALGAGIGLALAREVARAHGGDVVLVDGQEVGAAFELWMPITSTDSVPPDAPPRRLGIEYVSN